MILEALTEYYESLVEQEKLPRSGWNQIGVSYVLTIDENGELMSVTNVKKEDMSGKKAVLRPITMPLPERVKRSSGVSANFLCDNSSYILGAGTKERLERAAQCFEACKKLHHELLDDVDSPAARAILRFFDNWDVSNAENHPKIAERPDVLNGENIVFQFDGSYVHCDPQIQQAWQRKTMSDSSDEPMGFCPITGSVSPLARLHPLIKGVKGAQSSGASLVSFNEKSFCSYEKNQGYNAPISKYAASAYAAALSYLIGTPSHRRYVSDTSDTLVLFWAQCGNSAYSEAATCCFDGGDEKIEDSDLKAIVDAIVSGKKASFNGQNLSPDEKFYILGISPNVARLSVRFFLMDSFGAFIKRLWEHQNRLEIIRPSYDKREQLAFWQLLGETVRDKLKDSPSPLLAGSLVRAVLSGGPYPAALIDGATIRIRAERDIIRAKAAIIKAYYLRNENPKCPKEVLTVNLNEQTEYVPYVLGRLFSVLEDIQRQSAATELNSTIRDKYFNSASATPVKIFPLLMNLSEKHLRKLDTGARIHCEKKRGELLSKIHETYPERLTLAEQGAFQLGYYHETQKRYTKKEDK